jgi:hypothetical protein
MRNLLVRVLMGLMVWMPAQFASAGMIGTDVSTAIQSVDRGAVVAKLERFGVDPVQAQDRVGAMNDEEVRVLAERMDSLPAGQETSAAIAIILVVILVLWWNLRGK